MTQRIAVLLLISVIPIAAAEHEWRSYGNDDGGMRYSPLKQIDRSSVKRLRVAWTYRTGEVADRQPSTERNRVAAFETTPIIVGGVLYFSTQSSRVIALNPATGREIWKFDPQAGTTGRRRMQAHRGVAHWPGGRIIHGTNEGKLIALDARTGKPCADFGDNGVVDLRAGIADRWPRFEYAVTSPPAIYKDLAIVGAAVPEAPGKGPSGRVRAFNVRTGKLAWEFYTVPRPGEFGHETWEGDSWQDRTGVNVWAAMSVDSRRGIVYLPIGSPAYDFYGGDRKGDNLFGNSLVALDAATGKRLWHFQAVHHDVWDYDLPAQPLLATIGRTLAVIQLTKMGFVFAFDRVSGRSLFPIEERSVPVSTVPGEASSATQPFPTKPPPLARTRVTAEDLSEITPESAKQCREIFDAAGGSGGLFTPWGLKTTVMIPGTLGGATWSGGSFDPESSYLFVNINELGAVGEMKPQPAESPMRYRRGGASGEYARFRDSNFWPCTKPPWGTLQAVNMKTGEIAWKRPFGSIEALAERGYKDAGGPSLGGTIATAGGLVFIAGTSDSRIRAFDSHTGDELWSGQLPASGHATPATYWHRPTRKQFVVIAAGGGGFFSPHASDALVAFALP